MAYTLPKAILFDLDGTLVNNVSFHQEAWLRFLEKHNITISLAEFHTKSHGTIGELIVRFFGTDLSPKRIVELGQEKEQLYRDLYRDHLKEIAGLKPFLDFLIQQKCQLAVASMSDQPNIDLVLDGLAIRSYFTAIVGGHQVSKGKPDPEVFLKTANQLGVLPHECWVIEDTMSGVQAARAATIPVIGMCSTEKPETLLQAGCFAVVNDFYELKLILDES